MSNPNNMQDTFWTSCSDQAAQLLTRTHEKEKFQILRKVTTHEVHSFVAMTNLCKLLIPGTPLSLELFPAELNRNHELSGPFTRLFFKDDYFDADRTTDSWRQYHDPQPGIYLTLTVPNLSSLPNILNSLLLLPSLTILKLSQAKEGLRLRVRYSTEKQTRAMHDAVLATFNER